jgi:hypothetical protein
MRLISSPSLQKETAEVNSIKNVAKADYPAYLW